MKKYNGPDSFITSGRHISYWTETIPLAGQSPLKEDLETDVVIVGGGIAGLSVAYCLTQSGKKIVLVEDGHIGSGETGRTTAQLVTALDNRYYDLERLFGQEKTRLIAESHKIAIDFVEKTIKREKINCDFEHVNGYLFLHPSDRKDALQREFKAAVKAGVKIAESDHVPGILNDQKCLCFFNQAQIHPLKYINGLAGAVERKGGKLYTGTHASKINHKGITTAQGFKVKAKHIVVATNSPVNNILAIHNKQHAYRTYVIGALVKKDMLPKAFWWDTGDFKANPDIPPYHYVRVHFYNEQYDLLICGGEDHPTGDTSKVKIIEKDRYKLLEKWTRENFPIEEVVYRWSGQVLEPMDGVAFIGRNSVDHSNVYIVTGDSGNGMTHGSFAGLLINDLINGKENKWEKIYKPSRFTLKGSGSILWQNLKDLISHIMPLPRFNGKLELASVKNGEGKIIGLKKKGSVGVYRDNVGKLYIVSARCAHVKCSLVWNNDELSWDCPCHGSRFTYEGKVINGPANMDLPVFDEFETQ